MPFADRTKELAAVKSIVSGLIVLANHLRYYAEKNDLVQLSTSRLFLLLERYFAEEPLLELVIARHGVLWQGEFVERYNPGYIKFAQSCFMHGMASVQLSSSLSIASLHQWLRIVNRPPAETWDEGGIVAALAARSVQGIVVVELSDRHLQLGDGDDESRAADRPAVSDLWDRFALSLCHALKNDGSLAGCAPDELARHVSALLAQRPAESRIQHIREINQFVVQLQHENIRIYRARALEKLAGYINSLSAELKALFLSNVFNLSLRGEFAEMFYSKLSDDLIMGALQNAALKSNYVPPVVLSLLGKLASQRDLAAEVSRPFDDAQGDELERKTRELFKEDEFEKFVPESYRGALLQILRGEGGVGAGGPLAAAFLPQLECEAVEDKVARIVCAIVRAKPDERHFDGIRKVLAAMVADLADRGDYYGLREVYRLCTEAQQQGDLRFAAFVRETFEAAPLIATLLDGAGRFGKERYESLKHLIETVGDPFVEPLLDRLAGETNRSLRYFYIDVLKGLPGVTRKSAQRYADERWYYLRNMLYLARQAGDAAILPRVRQLLQHPHPRVRSEALKTCLHFRDSVAEVHLLGLLGASDAEKFAEGVNLARLAPTPKVVDTLCDFLLRVPLVNFRLEEKLWVVQVLIESRSPGVIPRLAEVLGSQSFLHPRQHEELKREIIRSLRSCDLAAVAPLLQAQADSSSPALAAAAREVLASYGEGGSHEPA